MYDLHSVTVIKDNIKDSLTKCDIKADVRLVNNNKVVCANDDAGLNLWVRLIQCNGLYIAEVANIVLPENKRGCGTFKILYNRLKRCKYIKEVRIINPCSDSMYRWIHKNNLKEVYYGAYV